jgi:MFS superfamily sulfate permease-like transporter
MKIIIASALTNPIMTEFGMNFINLPIFISAATGSVALVIVPLVKDHGVQYLLAATILMGIIHHCYNK